MEFIKSLTFVDGLALAAVLISFVLMICKAIPSLDNHITLLLLSMV